MLDFYQHVPQYIDPIAFSIGFFAVRWYSLAYVASFSVAFFLLKWRVDKGEADKLSMWDAVFSIFPAIFSGMIIGGRLGYVLFYGLESFAHDPLSIISPFSRETGEYVGIYGMSYHGAVAGIVFFSYAFSIVKKIDFWKVADFLIPAVAGAYFFGRVGNFFNGELFGRRTDFFWGMRFGEEDFLRHPSPLYEAFFEGLVIFFILWAFRNKAKFKGQLFLGYVIGYAFMRYFLEYFRAPDIQVGMNFLGLTMGQSLSLVMLAIGTAMYFQRRCKSAIIG